MGPIFVRRGEVLFVLKTPEDLLKSIKSGKIRPADRLLVKDPQGIEWIPISEIHQFRIDIDFNKLEKGKGLEPDSCDLLDHICQPRFNFRALLLGGFWYFLHGMPRYAAKRLFVATILICAVTCIGLASGFNYIQLLPLILAGWLLTSLSSALRADHDLNRMQVERFNQCDLQNLSGQDEEIPTVVSEHQPFDFHCPSIKEKVLN